MPSNAFEKVVQKSSLKEFRNRENPWINSSPAERLNAMAIICQTAQTDENSKRRFPRLYKITREK